MAEKDIHDAGIGEVFYTIINLSKYSDDERRAITGEIPLNEEIFKKCIDTALYLGDIGTIKSLIKKRPDFAEKTEGIPEKFLINR